MCFKVLGKAEREETSITCSDVLQGSGGYLDKRSTEKWDKTCQYLQSNDSVTVHRRLLEETPDQPKDSSYPEFRGVPNDDCKSARKSKRYIGDEGHVGILQYTYTGTGNKLQIQMYRHL
ncbi:hypothetical protein MAR_018426 [Mya arenaria]|uniref:Uncharacterized protein n=1 Tax=Mya arenaria TaxID=6604 RepID=A0ABY7EIJ4_MYAAR|nr:hypothetical protein MAR_018426 [Mya arenaria]